MRHKSLLFTPISMLQSGSLITIKGLKTVLYVAIKHPLEIGARFAGPGELRRERT